MRRPAAMESESSGLGERALLGGEGWGEGERLTISLPNHSQPKQPVFRQRGRESNPTKLYAKTQTGGPRGPVPAEQRHRLALRLKSGRGLPQRLCADA
jgi:hypothetical protein